MKKLKKFSLELQQVIDESRKQAFKYGVTAIDIEHLLFGLIASEQFSSYRLIQQLNGDLISLGIKINMVPHKLVGGRAYTDLASAVYNDALALAAESEVVDTKHLLVALLGRESIALKLLEESGVVVSQLRKQCIAAMQNEEGHQIVIETPVLDRHSLDLTQLARAKKLVPPIGRDHELDALITTLLKKNKRNVVLTGKPGVGKTNLIEGLAILIAEGRVPAKLNGYTIKAFNLASLVAGTKFRGEFEDRLVNIMREVSIHPTLILFIDEIHTIIGAGSAIGGLDASNTLKPALANGEFLCIGATTSEEYRKYFLRDPALARRFQPLHLEEPSESKTVEILKGLAHEFGKYHHVIFSDAVIHNIVVGSQRLYPDRHFPDKAIDLLDYVGAHFAYRMDPSTVYVIQETDVEQVIIDLGLAPHDNYQIAST